MMCISRKELIFIVFAIILGFTINTDFVEAAESANFDLTFTKNSELIVPLKSTGSINFTVYNPNSAATYTVDITHSGLSSINGISYEIWDRSNTNSGQSFPTNVPVADPGSTYELKITPGITASPGKYDITLTATQANDNTETEDETFSLYITDFEVTLSAETLEILPGNSGEATITIKSKIVSNMDTKFTGTITITNTSTNTLTGIDSVSFTEGTSFTLSGGGEKSTKIKFNINPTAATNGAGYIITINGTFGSENTQLTHTKSLTVKILPNPLIVTIQATPNPVTIFQGSTITVTVKDANSNPVSGSTVVLTRTGDGTFSNGQYTMTGTTDAQGMFTDTFIPDSKSNAIIKAQATKTGFTTAENTVTLEIKGDFNLLIAPASNTVNIGSSKTVEVTITSVQEFQSPVTITSSGAVEGITVQITPSSVVPQPNTPATANVMISVASSVTPDTYTITILAQSGILSKTQVVTIDVPLSDFTINITPSSNTISQDESTTYTLTITSVGGFNGAVQLSATNLLEGMIADFSPQTVYLVSGDIETSILTINATRNTPGKINHPIIIEGYSPAATASNNVLITILELYQVTVDTSTKLQISQIMVDGVAIQPENLPKVFNWTKGTTHTISIIDTIVDKQDGLSEDGIRYVFEGWNDGDTNTVKTVVAGEVTNNIRAVFNKEYKIELTTNPRDITEPSGGGWYLEGSIITINTNNILNISDTSRYKFDVWNGSINSENLITEIIVDEYKIITAEYIQEYKVRIITNPPDITNTPEVEIWYESGAEIEIEQPKRHDDFVFNRWTINYANEAADVSSNENPKILRITDSIILTAYYIQLPDTKLDLAEITPTNTAFQNEKYILEVGIENSNERNGNIILRVESESGNVLIKPSMYSIDIKKGDKIIKEFEVTFQNAGVEELIITIDDTSSNDDEIIKKIKIFNMEEKAKSKMLGKAIAIETISEQKLLIERNEEVLKLAEDILSYYESDSNDQTRINSVVEFFENHFEYDKTSTKKPYYATEMVKEFNENGGMTSNYRISGDSRIAQILCISLLESLGYETRPVVGTLLYSASTQEPSIILHSWLEVKIQNNWIIVDPSNNINMNNENNKLVYEESAKLGGILDAITFENEIIDITQEYRSKQSDYPDRTLIYVDGDLEIEVQYDNNLEFTSSKISHGWDSELSIQRIPLQVILIDSDIELEKIVIYVKGTTDTDYELTLVTNIEGQWEVESIQGMVKNSELKKHVINLPTADKNIPLITHISQIEFNNKNITIKTNGKILEYSAMEKFSRLVLEIEETKDQEMTIKISVPKSIIDEMISSNERLTVVSNGRIINYTLSDNFDEIEISISMNDIEGKVEIYLKSYNFVLTVFDPFSRIVNNADVFIEGPMGKEKRESKDTVFNNLIPGKYEFSVKYRGEIYQIPITINDTDKQEEIRVLRSDSVIAITTIIVLIVIVIITTISHRALSRVLPKDNIN